jgi:GAF domain-containing protein
MPVSTHEHLLQDLDSAARSAPNATELMRVIVSRLAELPHNNWVGFYMLQPGHPGEPEQMLVLGPFVGADTPHKRIPLDRGICGAAAASGETVVVDDVHSDPRYLACSIETKSEIVVPVYAHGRVVGELDIDSHTPAAFSASDRELVEACAMLVGSYLERRR